MAPEMFAQLEVEAAQFPLQLQLEFLHSFSQCPTPFATPPVLSLFSGPSCCPCAGSAPSWLASELKRNATQSNLSLSQPVQKCHIHTMPYHAMPYHARHTTVRMYCIYVELTHFCAPSHSADERQSRKLLLFQQFFTRFVLKPRATIVRKSKPSTIAIAIVIGVGAAVEQSLGKEALNRAKELSFGSSGLFFSAFKNAIGGNMA